MKRLRSLSSTIHPLRNNRSIAQCRHNTPYAFGTQWTGSLSRPVLFPDETPELSPQETLAGDVQAMVPMEMPAALQNDGGVKCVAGAAGWGHSALLVKRIDRDIDKDTKLLVCGRPHDFQTLMRLRRLPAPLRRMCIAYTSNNDSTDYDGSSGDSSPSLLQRMVTFLAGENEVTVNEDECRRLSNVQRLMEVELPSGEVPALEGEVVTDQIMASHGRQKYMTQQNDATNNIKPLHNQFQNTLATSAGLTAIISNTGTLYTFGLNHRGQCGTGSFTPNIWKPTPVVGLSSLRFKLDYNDNVNSIISDDDSASTKASNPSGSDVYKDCKVQEYPIVSVSLGLQHGIALDCMGQIFCWGKGERGQLGQSQYYLHEALEESGVDVSEFKKKMGAELNQELPHENKTLEYAMQVANFYDPYASISCETEDIYAPLLSPTDSKIRLVGAGMNFSMAVTESNLPYIWGKNCLHNPSYNLNGINIRGKPVIDSPYPRFIPGLPPNVKICKIACGTHHASMLLEDGSIYAVGVATDQPIPMWNEAVEILPPNVVSIPTLISFTAGFDRTFVVFGDEVGARQMIEIQLWSKEEMRMNGSVRPSWVDWLEEEHGDVDGESDVKKKVKSVHRGWMHTVVITEH